MSKIKHKIVVFIEPNDNAYKTPLKIGNLFMNRFAVDEDAASEILNIFEVDRTSRKMSNPEDPEYKKFEKERKHKGTDLISKFNYGRLFKNSPY